MNQNLVRFVGLLGVASLAACGNAVTDLQTPQPEVPKFSCLSNSATMRLPADLRATLPVFGGRHPDDAFVSISQSVPGGFAGVFVEDDTHFVLTFVDPVLANASRATIQQAFDDQNLRVDVSKAEFRGARWTFAELDEWYRYITPRVGGTSGISSIDIDEKANTIAFGVIDETARGLLESQLAANNVSCNLVTTVIRGYVTFD